MSERFAPAPDKAPLLLSLASAGILSAALVFQYALGYHPCQLCHWQRVPYAAGLGLFLLPLLAGRAGRRIALVSGVIVFAAAAALAGFHVGVEQGWWQGPLTCASDAKLPSDPDAALAAIMTAPVVRCDEIAWSFLGLSMAAWNGLIALALTAYAATALVRDKEETHARAHRKEKGTAAPASGR